MLFKTAFFVFSTDESNFLIYEKKPLIIGIFSCFTHKNSNRSESPDHGRLPIFSSNQANQ